MRCFCCDQEISCARKVKIRRWPNCYGAIVCDTTAAQISYREQMTYRWGVVCEDCYALLDNQYGADVVCGETFNLAGTSRRGKGRVIDVRQYRQFQRREAKKLGLELADEELPG